MAEGLADLRSRLDGTTVVALRSASPDRRRGRIALVAAAVVLLAGAIGVAVVARGDDGGRDVQVTTPPDGSATGWYVPEDLPAGWTLESVRGDFRDAGNREGIEGDCPCPWTTWTSDDGIAVLTLGSAANEAPTATPPAGSGAASRRPDAVDPGVGRARRWRPAHGDLGPGRPSSPPRRVAPDQRRGRPAGPIAGRGPGVRADRPGATLGLPRAHPVDGARRAPGATTRSP